MQDISADSMRDKDPFDMRKEINQRIMNIEAPTPVVGHIENLEIQWDQQQTTIRLYTPSHRDNLPIILMIHGGAWVAGSLDTHDHMARYLCSETPALVVSVGYLNSPEGKFPYPLEQCYDALLWVHEQAKKYGGNPEKLAIVGDSAGGNMTAALCLLSRDRHGPQAAVQVLINPAPNLHCPNAEEQNDPCLDRLKWQAVQYLSDLNDTTLPYVSPLLAKDLSCLPPAVVLLAEQDELREAGQQYADRLLSAGNPVQVYCQKGIGHLAGDGARASLRARESLNVAISALQKVFFQSPCDLQECP